MYAEIVDAQLVIVLVVHEPDVVLECFVRLLTSRVRYM